MNEASYTKEEIEAAIEEVLRSTGSKFLPLMAAKMAHFEAILKCNKAEGLSAIKEEKQ